MKKTVSLSIIMLLILFLSVSIISCTISTSTTTTSTDNLEAVVRDAWLRQAGSGMFFGNSPDLKTGTSQTSYAFLSNDAGIDGSFGSAGMLNVSGLDSQFPDGTQLWLKFTCPGNGFGSPNVTFRIEKIIQNDNNKFITNLVTEFSIPVNSNAEIMRFQMPVFNTGQGTYTVTAFTNGQQRFSRWVRCLAPGESPDPTFTGY